MTSRFAGALCIALAVLTAVHCSSRVDGLELSLGVMHRAGTEPPYDGLSYDRGEVRAFVTDTDFGVVLQRALVVIGAVELVPCDDDDPGTAWFEGLSPLAVARAHGEMTPLRLATEHVVNLMGDDHAVIELTGMNPPPGRYCQVRLTIADADEATRGVPSDVELLGKTLIIEGTHVAADDDEEVRFALRSDLVRETDLAITDVDGEATALELSDGTPTGDLRFVVNYGGLLNGIDFAADEAVLQEFLVIKNLFANTEAILCDDAPTEGACADPTGTLR